MQILAVQPAERCSLQTVATDFTFAGGLVGGLRAQVGGDDSRSDAPEWHMTADRGPHRVPLRSRQPILTERPGPDGDGANCAKFADSAPSCRRDARHGEAHVWGCECVAYPCHVVSGPGSSPGRWIVLRSIDHTGSRAENINDTSFGTW